MNNEMIITEGSLSDSVIYKSFNNNSEMTKLLLSAIKDSIVIDNSYIEEQLMQIKRTHISPLSNSVIKAYEEGEVVLMYSNTKKVPQALPFFVTRISGQIKAVIFVNNYATISKSEVDSSKKFLNISMKDLYVLLEGAYTAKEYAVYPTKLDKSLPLMKTCSSIYTNMILRILNKEYALSLDTDVYQSITFCISRFFMERVWMFNNQDIIFSYAKSNIIGTPNITSLMTVNDMYSSKNIETIDQLLMFLKELTPKVKTLTFRYFLQCFINTYKAGAMFGLECLPYFIYVLEATMIGSFLVNQPLIADITKTTKNMNHFYPELVKAIQ